MPDHETKFVDIMPGAKVSVVFNAIMNGAAIWVTSKNRLDSTGNHRIFVDVRFPTLNDKILPYNTNGLRIEESLQGMVEWAHLMISSGGKLQGWE